MILADTSVWIDHFRAGNDRLRDLLENFGIGMHPFIVGELALGTLRDREKILGLLRRLPTLVAATHEETLFFIEKNRLPGRGIGYVDAHLLASAALSDGVRIWTLDRRLLNVAESLGLAA